MNPIKLISFTLLLISCQDVNQDTLLAEQTSNKILESLENRKLMIYNPFQKEEVRREIQDEIFNVIQTSRMTDESE